MSVLPHTRGQTFYARFAPRHYEKIGVMKSKIIKIKLVGNNSIAPEEEQKIWNEAFDFIFKKSISEKQSPAVDRESQELKSRDIKN